MKYLIIFFFLLTKLVSTKRCFYESDCDKNMCCVATVLSHFAGLGVCLHFSKLNKACSKNESRSDYYGGKYLSFCPCEYPFVCLPEKDRMICKENDVTTEQSTTQTFTVPTIPTLPTIPPL